MIDLRKIDGRPVVVSLSGGKDSTATALHLRDLGVDFSCVFADTGWEAPATYRYIDDVLEPLFGPIARVKGDYRGASTLPRHRSICRRRQDLRAVWLPRDGPQGHLHCEVVMKIEIETKHAANAKRMGEP